MGATIEQQAGLIQPNLLQVFLRGEAQHALEFAEQRRFAQREVLGHQGDVQLWFVQMGAHVGFEVIHSSLLLVAKEVGQLAPAGSGNQLIRSLSRLPVWPAAATFDAEGGSAPGRESDQ